MITQKEVAQKAGVSRSTVRDVLNGYSCVGDTTRRRVLEVLKELNYRPHSSARELIGRRNTQTSTTRATTIDLWWYSRPDDFHVTLRQRIEEAFTLRCPDITLHTRYDTSTPHWEAMDRLFLALATGPAPSCQYIAHPYFQKFARLGLCADITALVESWEERDQFDPRAWDIVNRDGKCFGVPTANASIMFLHMNRQLFDAQGIDASKPPQSWDEVIEYAQRLTSARKGRYGLALPSLDGDLPYFFIDLLYAHGGQIRAGAENWGVSLDEEPAVQALQLIHDLRWKHKVLPPTVVHSWVDLRDDFLRGRFAMLPDNLILQKAEGPIKSLDEIALAPLPVGPTGQRFCQLGIGSWIINSQSTPSQLHAAWEFLKFQASRENLIANWRAHQEHGQVFPLLLARRGIPEIDKVRSELPLAWRKTIKQAEANCQIVRYPSGYELELLRTILLRLLTNPSAKPHEELRRSLKSS
jgi:multiple sugar transport system substrate-binding protein